MEALPRKLAAVEIGNAVGGEVGDLDLQEVAARFECRADVDDMRLAPGNAARLFVEEEPGGVGDLAQIDQTAAGTSGFEGGAVAGGAGEIRGIGERRP